MLGEEIKKPYSGGNHNLGRKVKKRQTHCGGNQNLERKIKDLILRWRDWRTRKLKAYKFGLTTKYLTPVFLNSSANMPSFVLTEYLTEIFQLNKGHFLFLIIC